MGTGLPDVETFSEKRAGAKMGGGGSHRDAPDCRYLVLWSSFQRGRSDVGERGKTSSSIAYLE